MASPLAVIMASSVAEVVFPSLVNVSMQSHVPAKALAPPLLPPPSLVSDRHAPATHDCPFWHAALDVHDATHAPFEHVWPFKHSSFDVHDGPPFWLLQASSAPPARTATPNQRCMALVMCTLPGFVLQNFVAPASFSRVP
jgi:hypothetical protein